MTIHTFGLNSNNTVQSCVDAELNQASPTSVGNGDRFSVSNVSGNQKKAVIFFPGIKSVFDAIGAITINSVTLRLRRLNTVTAPNRNVELRRLLVSFTESQTTWNNRATGTAWGTAGALGAGDADTVVLATGVMPSSGGSYFAVSGAGLTQLVRDIVAGTVTDYGFVIALENPTTTGSGDFDIGSAQRGTDLQRPYLEIDYTIAAPPTVTVADWNGTSLDGNASFVLTLSSEAPVGGCSVSYASVDGTSTNGTDHSNVSGTVSFVQGELTKTILVPVIPRV